MDRLTLIGVLLGLAAILGGSEIKGSGVEALWSPAAFLIVVVGTLAAVLVQTPGATFMRAFGILRWAVRPPAVSSELIIKRIVAWAKVARSRGLLGLESQIPKETDLFVRNGLQMLVDGLEPEEIRAILEVEVSSAEARDISAARVFEGMGVYAPTLGIVGAVIGLMSVMQNLSDPDSLGPGIAAAVVATVYGIASANLVFLPISAKLKSVIAQQIRIKEMIIEGLISVALGDNPRAIESKLQGFMV